MLSFKLMAESIVKQKSYAFALKIIKLCVQLRSAKHFEISSQLLRSGTSIGANVEEALAGQSKKKSLKCLLPQKKPERQIIGCD